MVMDRPQKGCGLMMGRFRRAWFDDAQAQKECWFVIADPEEAWLDDGQAPKGA